MGQLSEVSRVLRQQVMAGLHLGTLRPGDRLTSSRDLASELRVDPRLVMAAYRQLASEGLVALRPRSGVFVPEQPRTGDALLPDVAAWILDLFMRGVSRGVPPTELRRQARACLDTVKLRAACLECNHDQLEVICREIRGAYGIETSPVDLGRLGKGPPPRVLARADLLLTTRFHVGEVQRLARRVRRPIIVVALDSGFVAEMRRVLEKGPVWYVCTDPRFAAKLPRIFSGLGRIFPIVIGRDRLDAIPPEATVYAMPSARRRLPRAWSRRLLVSGAPVFSVDTAEALLTFILRRNLLAVRRKQRAPA